MKRTMIALLALMLLLTGCEKKQQGESLLVSTNSYIETVAPMPVTTAAASMSSLPLVDDESLSTPGPTIDVETLDNIVHEFGESNSLIEYNENFSCTIQYPVTQIQAIDREIKSWAEETIESAHQQVDESNIAEAKADLNVSYNTYLVGNKFSSVEEIGFFDAAFLEEAQPVIRTFNIDMKKKQIIANDAIIETSKQSDVVALLKEKILTSFSELNEEDLEQADYLWLENPSIQAEGIEFVLGSGICLPNTIETQNVLLSYEELGEDSLAFTKSIPSTDPNFEIPEETPNGSQILPMATAAGGVAIRATIDPDKPMVALTFDDGPSKTTTKILNILSENGGRATFFVVGNRVYDYADTTKEIVNQGSEVGSHTWDHKKLTLLSNAEITKELVDTNDIVYTVANVRPKVLRPPYGSVNDKVKSVAKGEDMAIANWSIDTLDWKTKNASATYDAIMKDVKDGSIILAHDLHPETGDAMEKVIPELVKRGYQLVTVSELLEYKKGGFEAGKLYP